LLLNFLGLVTNDLGSLKELLEKIIYDAILHGSLLQAKLVLDLVEFCLHFFVDVQRLFENLSSCFFDFLSSDFAIFFYLVDNLLLNFLGRFTNLLGSLKELVQNIVNESILLLLNGQSRGGCNERESEDEEEPHDDVRK